MTNKGLNHNIDNVYLAIKEIIQSARRHAYRAVNFTMVKAYWHVGRVIVEEEQNGQNRAEYGKELIINLSKRLKKECGTGFGKNNLFLMRKFYLTYPTDQKVHAVTGKSEKIRALPGKSQPFEISSEISPELSWTHYTYLLKIENPKIRDFYLAESIQNNWSTRQLERQINSFYYERLLSSQNKDIVQNDAKAKAEKLTPEDIIKDPYVLEFLQLRENKNFLEKDLEQGLIDKLKNFLLELGKGFSFVERQKRITADGDHFYIDLVFYNYILKCFFLVDLKTNKLTHQDIGQMDFYVRYFEDQLKQDGDNPTVGLILCSEKNETVAKYSVLTDDRNIFASKYKLYLPTEKELQEELEREKRILELEMGE